jgi:hypothetical protein
MISRKNECWRSSCQIYWCISVPMFRLNLQQKLQQPVPAHIYLYMYDVRKCRSNTTIQHNLSATTSAVWVFYVNSKIRNKIIIINALKMKEKEPGKSSIRFRFDDSWCSDWFPSSLKYWRCGMTKISCVPAIEFEKKKPFVDCWILLFHTRCFVSVFEEVITLRCSVKKFTVSLKHTTIYLSLLLSLYISLLSRHTRTTNFCVRNKVQIF